MGFDGIPYIYTHEHESFKANEFVTRRRAALDLSPRIWKLCIAIVLVPAPRVCQSKQTGE